MPASIEPAYAGGLVAERTDAGFRRLPFRRRRADRSLELVELPLPLPDLHGQRVAPRRRLRRFAFRRAQAFLGGRRSGGGLVEPLPGGGRPGFGVAHQRLERRPRRLQLGDLGLHDREEFRAQLRIGRLLGARRNGARQGHDARKRQHRADPPAPLPPGQQAQSPTQRSSRPGSGSLRSCP